MVTRLWYDIEWSEDETHWFKQNNLPFESEEQAKRIARTRNRAVEQSGLQTGRYRVIRVLQTTEVFD